MKKYIIYKGFGGKWEGTPEDNYSTRIQDARRIQKFDKFDNPNQIIDYLEKYGKGDYEYVVKDDVKESVEHNPLDDIPNGKMRAFEMPDGITLYLGYEDGKLYAGSSTNTGVAREYEIDYDNGKSLEYNLQDLYDTIIEGGDYAELEECGNKPMHEDIEKDKYEVNHAHWNGSGYSYSTVIDVIDEPISGEEYVKETISNNGDDYFDGYCGTIYVTDLDGNQIGDEYWIDNCDKPMHEDIEMTYRPVYMNTWANYNEYGADLSTKYGIDNGWMTIEEAREFAEKYADDEPFINDINGVPFDVDEYDNVDEVLDMIEETQDLDDRDKEIISAIMDVGGYDYEEAKEKFDNDDYIWFDDINSSDLNLGSAYIDMFGSIEEAVGDKINNYFEWDAYKDYIRSDYEQSMYADARYDKERVAEEFDVEEDEVTDDMIEEYVENHIDDELDYWCVMVDSDMDNMLPKETIEEFFDYEAFGRDLYLNGDFSYYNDGAIHIF